MKNLPIYLIDDDGSEMIVNSIVSEPAHQKYALKFNQSQNVRKLRFNEEGRIVSGVVIAANLPIYRNDNGMEYLIAFTPKAIRNLAFKYFKSNKFNLIDVEHDGKVRADAVVMIESFFTDENKRFKVDEDYVDAGSWVASYKVLDDNIWELLKKDALKGFSVEVLADVKEFKLGQNGNGNENQIAKNKNDNLNSTIMENLKNLTDKVQEVLGNLKKFSNTKKFAEIQTIDGVTLRYDSLEVGQPIYLVAQDGTEVLAPEGSYVVEIDGVKKEIIVGKDGIISAINEVQQSEPPQTDAEMKEVLSKTVETIELLAKRIAQIEQQLAKFSKRQKYATSESKNGVESQKSWKDIQFKI